MQQHQLVEPQAVQDEGAVGGQEDLTITGQRLDAIDKLGQPGVRQMILRFLDQGVGGGAG